ncbi:unnamed protein product, partial [Amoebophrya sp. A25]
PLPDVISGSSCRVVGILERVEKDTVVGTVVEHVRNQLKFQPRDSRLPAWLLEAPKGLRDFKASG